MMSWGTIVVTKLPTVEALDVVVETTVEADEASALEELSAPTSPRRPPRRPASMPLSLSSKSPRRTRRRLRRRRRRRRRRPTTRSSTSRRPSRRSAEGSSSAPSSGVSAAARSHRAADRHFRVLLLGRREEQAQRRGLPEDAAAAGGRRPRRRDDDGVEGLMRDAASHSRCLSGQRPTTPPDPFFKQTSMRFGRWMRGLGTFLVTELRVQ